MDLQVFIRETIAQIAKGITEADAAIKECGGAVNPRDVATNKSGEGPYGVYVHDRKGQHYRPIESIAFDVVVAVSEEKETKGGIGIHVGAIGVGSAGKSGSGSGSESRIQFRIPVMLPVSRNA
jgi:hypothetical protein